MQAQKIRLDTAKAENKTVYPILYIIGLAHLLNDALQSVVPALFPVLQSSMGLTFTQLGLIAFALNATSSLIQPVVGIYTDKRPSPYALPIGLTFSLFGIIGLALAQNFWLIIVSVLFIGLGSAAFHPEGSRVAYMAAGNRRGLAQSIYQVGGNSGQALAPLMAAYILLPLGQKGVLWFTIVAAAGVILLLYIAAWYKQQVLENAKPVKMKTAVQTKEKKKTKSNKRIILFSISLLIFLVFARSWFHAGITNFYAFYVIQNYGLPIADSQIYIFVFLGAGAVGTFFGGPLADRFGKRMVISLSMLGSAPLALLLPFVGATFAYVLVAIIGFIILSSFSVTVVYAQELVPGRIGLVSGLIVGLAFGMGAVGSVALGVLADWIGLTNTIIFTACLPLIGLLTFFLPTDQKVREMHE
ncbi:Fosmidomycin resistance protein [Bacillus sp. LL01]|uniref:MFS transporter n=1 Tax=Bacillus sp. LL01 TaxID=1665556 RepID=UPI00064D1506|nr:MFS transporter [Bacillus sp. LL01]KMJ59538.1 Fosmidomycin resistance protein [Bacillus sp. LL01]